MSNEPAFPIIGEHEQVCNVGMTLRDYFAARALQGMIANDGYEHLEPDQFAYYVYKYADSLLAERAKK